MYRGIFEVVDVCSASVQLGFIGSMIAHILRKLLSFVSYVTMD